MSRSSFKRAVSALHSPWRPCFPVSISACLCFHLCPFTWSTLASTHQRVLLRVWPFPQPPGRPRGAANHNAQCVHSTPVSSALGLCLTWHSWDLFSTTSRWLLLIFPSFLRPSCSTPPHIPILCSGSGFLHDTDTLRDVPVPLAHSSLPVHLYFDST